MASTSTTESAARLAQYCIDAFGTLGNNDRAALELLIVGAIADYTNALVDGAIADAVSVGDQWGEVARTTKTTIKEIVKKLEERKAR